MNLKEKITQAGQARYLVDAPARWKTYFARVLFLALLVPVVAGQLAAAERYPSARRGVPPDPRPAEA